MSKQILRRQILEMRDGMDILDRDYLNSRLTSRIMSLEHIKKANTVMCYVSFGSEADTYEIMNRLWTLGKQIVVPRVNGDEMEFFFIKNKSDLVPGYKGIMEPKEGCEKYEPSKGDIMLVPGAVFDERLFRIGYGKGFYDRYLEKHKGLYAIGMCFDFQVVDAIPVDKWDRGLDIIVTEKRNITY